MPEQGSNHPPAAPRKVPSGDDLLREWEVCPDHHWNFFCQKCESVSRGFRLLANWLKDIRLETALEVPEFYKRLYEDYAVSLPTEAVEERLERLKLRSSVKRFRFFNSLLRDWCIREADNENAWRNRDFKSACLNTGLGPWQALDLTFLHKEMLEIVPVVRASLDESRKELSTAIMSFRQRQKRDLDPRIIGQDGQQEEIPPSEKWEQQWCSNLGVDKKSRMLSRQYLWSIVFVPLVNRLRPLTARRKELNWKSDSTIVPDEPFKKSSRLLHLRYPEYWPDNWQLVKNRYLAKLVR